MPHVCSLVSMFFVFLLWSFPKQRAHLVVPLSFLFYILYIYIGCSTVCVAVCIGYCLSMLLELRLRLWSTTAHNSSIHSYVHAGMLKKTCTMARTRGKISLIFMNLAALFSDDFSCLFLWIFGVYANRNAGKSVAKSWDWQCQLWLYLAPDGIPIHATQPFTKFMIFNVLWFPWKRIMSVLWLWIQLFRESGTLGR